MVKKPFARSYWVVPGKLLAGCYPGSKDPDEAWEKLEGLLDCGIRLVVNLMEAHETDFDGNDFVPYQQDLMAMASRRGTEVYLVRQPIPDYGVPSEAQMIRILDIIDEAVSKDLPVYVHCWGGRGRTGTVVGCYLARHRIATGPNVLRRIAELRRDDPTRERRSPESPGQIEMVTGWPAGL